MKREIMDEIRSLRRKLHETPEPAFREKETMACLKEYLGRLENLEVVDRGTWFYAAFHGNDTAPAVAFRADFDAVEGKDSCVGHFCGHDGHAAILAGFGRYLSETMPCRTVYLIFQPAEEIGEGAKLCRELLREKNIAEIYGFHNIPGYPKNSILVRQGTFACASTGLSIELEGTPAHAAYPENGKNPARAIADLILLRDEILRQERKGLAQATVIGVDLGSSAYGVSASRGELRLTLRGEYEEEYRALVNTFCQRAENLAEDEGMQCRIQRIEEFPATTNHMACVERIARAAQKLGLETMIPKEPFRWSEDFGYYLQICEGAFFGVGDGVDYPPLHTEAYEFPDEIAETVCDLYEELL